ncbi:hypothetical protein BH18ACT4_BH18ACT4_03900 [soil metagenome]
MLSAVVLTGWYIGFVIAAVTITAVVVLVAIILGLARRIGSQAVAIEAALAESQVNTEPLWEMSIANDTLRDIVNNAATARMNLEEA